MEAIGIAIGVVLLALVAVFAFHSTNSGIENGNRAIAKTEKISAALDESEYTQYDNTIVTGSQVLQVIKSNTEKGVTISVKMKAGDAVDYVYGASDAADKIKNATTRGNAAYIAPSGLFYGTITRSTSTNEITKLTFELQ